VNPRETELVNLLPPGGEKVSFPDWKQSAYEADLGAVVPSWLSLKHRGHILMENARDEETGALTLMVGRADVTPF
jgi:hypothetical protein